MKRHICVFLLLFATNPILRPQKNINNLTGELTNAKQDTTKIRILNKLGHGYLDSRDIDSALVFFNRSLKLARKNHNKALEAKAIKNIGLYYDYKGNYKKALLCNNQLLTIYHQLNDSIGITYCYNSIGIILENQGNYEKALNHYQKALNLAKDIDNLKFLSKILNNIGMVHMHLKSYKKALEYFKESLQIKTQLKNQFGIAISYNNIGLVYNNMDSLNLSLEYYKRSLEILEKLDAKRNIGVSLLNIGEVYQQKESFIEAEKYYFKALEMLEILDDKWTISNVTHLLSEFYLKYGDYLSSEDDKMKKYLLAVQYAKRTLNIALNMNNYREIKRAYYTLSEAYSALNDFKKAYFYSVKVLEYKDSLFSKEKTQAIQEMETKYQTEKKEQQIKILNKEKALHQSEIRRQRILIFSVGGGLVMMVILAFLIYKRYKEKTRANRLLQEKNIQINQQNEEIITQRDEIEDQRDEISTQRDSIKEQKQILEKVHKELTQSITYAKRIQSAALPTKNILDAVIPQRVIFYQPQGIVGGDFYWATKKDLFRIVVAADCTGHGVPGGFMSMLGMTYLNEIINKENIVQPCEILNKLRQYVIEALHQKGQAGSIKDGMDISICALNTKNNQLLIAGANNPVFIIKEKRNDTIPENAIVGNNEYLLEVKTDKMPVSISDRMDSFSQQKFPLNGVKMAYMASDGFADQFGGPNARKYLRKNLKKFLLEIYKKPFKEQARSLKKEFYSWKGEEQQIDDVLVMGFNTDEHSI